MVMSSHIPRELQTNLHLRRLSPANYCFFLSIVPHIILNWNWEAVRKLNNPSWPRTVTGQRIDCNWLCYTVHSETSKLTNLDNRAEKSGSLPYSRTAIKNVMPWTKNQRKARRRKCFAFIWSRTNGSKAYFEKGDSGNWTSHESRAPEPGKEQSYSPQKNAKRFQRKRDDLNSIISLFDSVSQIAEMASCETGQDKCTSYGVPMASLF